jgi:hypothetical protein
MAEYVGKVKSIDAKPSDCTFKLVLLSLPPVTVHSRCVFGEPPQTR